MSQEPPTGETQSLRPDSDPRAAQAWFRAERSAHPERIGLYRILEALGEGGMGVVYLAEQEKPIHRRVALKIIKLGMDTKTTLARFEAEREALALMNHPNVAKVFDAGATETGRPYFVMEHVPGLPITAYCDKHRLTTDERLRLFIEVCNAVQHAHQKGIIHRDIKPSNVLIAVQDDKPVPKVIDFGVAKATQQKLTDLTLFTELGQLIGTPGYMSPEQAEMTALDIDTRTDIYSLGVLLYELLVGALPFDNKTLRAGGFAEIQRIIREVEPFKPSTRLGSLGADSATVARNRKTEARSLLRQVRGDLDWIVMKCLEKDRTRRYDTANGLAQDILRHLASEPVLAGPPSSAYRLRKFLRRNKLPVAAITGLFIIVLVGFIASDIQRRRAQYAEKLAGLYALRHAADWHIQEGKFGEARRWAKAALAEARRLAEEPDARADLLRQYALLLLTIHPADLRDPQAAALIARRAVARSGGRNGDILGTLALAQYRAGDLEEARAGFTTALTLIPRGRSPLRQKLERRLAEVLIERAEFGAAEKLLMEQYSEIEQDPQASSSFKLDLLRIIIRLYSRWHAEEPEQSFDAKIVKWQEQLADTMVAAAD